MDGRSSILYVAHDDDGFWQFLDGGDVNAENAMTVSLGEVAGLEPEIKRLADVPRGWYAIRDAVGKPWKRAKDSE